MHINFDKETSMVSRCVLLIIILALYAASLLVAQSAMAWPCSIRPKKGTAQADLQKMTKVSKEGAQATALANPKITTATSVSGPELERGCLVYSFDVQAAGQKAVTEIVVDAGTGNILSRKNESEAKEAAKKAAEKNPSGNKH
jgi:hypothetical protein